MSPRTSEKGLHNDIPDDVISCEIFPQFPFKLVTRFKVVSKKYHELLTNNSMLVAKQSRLCPPCPALIHISCTESGNLEAIDVLSSKPDIVSIPSGFGFLDCSLENGFLSLLASTNGLILVLYTPKYAMPHFQSPILFRANPATQKASSITGSANHITRFDMCIGLMFDPMDDDKENTSKFMIVKALAMTIEGNGTKFRFATFSSSLATGPCLGNKKVAYGSGIMYWDYHDLVLWFDIANIVAGVIKMPWILLNVEVKGPIRHNIDISTDGTLLRSGLRTERLTERRLMRPIGMEDGRFVYIGVRQEWKTKDRILQYGIVTRKT
uniref:F-box domain-containing protein n=1 Tax=Oryza brachyantha TaxID=4533 RepID=J3KUS3_ORYBR